MLTFRLELCLAGRGAVRVAYLHGVQVVAGSNPVAPIFHCSLTVPSLLRVFFALFLIEKIPTAYRRETQKLNKETGNILNGKT